MQPPFATDVAMLPITVAALMTTEWIAKHLTIPAGTDLVLIPGLCEGATSAIADHFAVRVEKGPKDLREIPEYFGEAAAREEYGAWDIEIIAEINNAPRLSREAIMREALRFRDSGADYIDIGCTPGLAFPELDGVVRDLVSAGLRVSIDTFNAGEIRTAVSAGATLVLSINASNLDVARELAGRGIRVVALPDFGAPLESIAPTLELLSGLDIPFLIDPIIEPIGFGFTASIERYAEARRRWPGAEMMMGVGNITELTAADSTGVNALLIAICQELGIRAVLTTEVIPWAHGSVREIDIARRLMYHAVTNKVVPKRVDDRLVTVKDPRILEYGESELRELQSHITDPNFRIFTDRDTITVLNRDLFVRGTDIQEIFSQLGVDEATHAFYLGKELAKAKLAITLGKTYRQEGSLSWGYLTPPDDVKAEHVRLTQRSRRRSAPEGGPKAP
jgi:dihydropteroate synthase-like protein